MHMPGIIQTSPVPTGPSTAGPMVRRYGFPVAVVALIAVLLAAVSLKLLST